MTCEEGHKKKSTFERRFGFGESSSEPLQLIVEFVHFLQQPELHRIPRQLDVGSLSAAVETRLRQLHRDDFVLDGFAQVFDVFLLLDELTKSFG